MDRMFGERSGQVQEVALDIALLTVFVMAWIATRSIHEIARWFPDLVTVSGMAIITVKLAFDLYALTKPAPSTDESGPRM